MSLVEMHLHSFDKQKKGTFGQWEPIKMCSAYRRTPSWLNLMGPEYAAFYNA